MKNLGANRVYYGWGFRSQYKIQVKQKVNSPDGITCPELEKKIDFVFSYPCTNPLYHQLFVIPYSLLLSVWCFPTQTDLQWRSKVL